MSFQRTGLHASRILVAIQGCKAVAMRFNYSQLLPDLGEKGVYSSYTRPQDIITILERNNIHRALVTSTPPEQVIQLFQKAPSRILALLGVYRTAAEKESWYRDEELPSRVETLLKHGYWRGIGQLHLFAKDRNSPVFAKIIKPAQLHQPPLLLHVDPAVIDRAYELAPDQPVTLAAL